MNILESFQELEIIVCVLGSGQYTYVENCPSQKIADFIRCIENVLWYYYLTKISKEVNYVKVYKKILKFNI